MTKSIPSTTKLTSLAIDAIQQRFPEKEIKAMYIRLIRNPREEAVIKVQLCDNTFWQLRQKLSGNMSWKQIDVPVG